MARRYRVLIAIAAFAVALPVVLCAALLVLANTDHGRRLIEHGTERLSGGQVLLQGLAGRFPGQLRLARLQLRDPQGLWLEAEDLQLDWSPLPLLQRHARVGLLQAARVAVARASAYPARVPPGKSTGLWLRELRVDRLDVQRLELGAPLVGNAVALRVQGSARIASWQQAALQLTAQRLDEVPATYRAAAQIDGAQVQAQLDVEEDADGPLTHLIQLPGLGALSMHLRLDGPRDAVNAQLAARAGALQASAAGTVDLTARSAALQLTLDAPAMSPRPDLSWRRLSLHGSWTGSLTAPLTTMQLDMTGLVAGPLRLDALAAELHGEGEALQLDARLLGLNLPQPVLGLLAEAPLEVHAQTRLADATRAVQFTLSHPLFAADGRWNMPGDATLSLALKEIKPLAALAGVDLQGRGTMQAQLHSTGQARRIELTGALAVERGQAPLVRLLAPRAQVSATLSFQGGSFEIERSQLAAPKLQLSLHGRDVLGTLGLDYKFTLPDLAALSPVLAGDLSGLGQLQGTAPRLTLSADINGKLSAHGAPSGPIHLGLRARDLPQRPNGRIELSGTLDGAPLRLAASAEREPQGALSARIERGDWKSARLSGVVRIDPKGADPQGRLELHFPRLADLDRLLGQAVQGSLEASVLFDRSSGHPRARVTLEAHDAGVATQQFQLLQLRGDVIEPLARPVLALHGSAQAVRNGMRAKLNVDLRGPAANLRAHAWASLQVDVASALQLDTSATLHLDRGDLRLTALRAEYRGQTLQLLAPTMISFADGWAVEQLRLGMADTTLQASGRLTPTLDLHASLRDFTPSLLRLWLPDLQAAGRIDADADLTGTLAQPLGPVRLQARGLRASTGAARALPSTDIDASAQLREQVAQVELQVRAGDALQMQLNGQAPLKRDAPIALKVSGSINLSVVNPIIEASGQRVLGHAKIDAEFAGTPAAPQARGTLLLSGADLQDYPRGAHLSDVSATLHADGTQLQLEQFTAHAGSGTITASGTLGLGEGELPVALQITARGARPLASDLLTATVDMDLKLSGGLRTQLDAAGSVRIDRADINIPNALPPSVAVLNVVRPGQTPVPPSKSRWTIVMLNLTVAAPRAVFVRGRGLNAEVGGQLHIAGTGADPEISGGFELRNGTVNLGGTTLTFSTGRVGFNGSGVKKKIDPTLDFTANNTSGGVTATLNVGGYADAPVISLSSTPEMPQDEILSRLLFGVSVTQLSSLQLAQIGAALATMGGVGGGSFNPINAVQRKLGLDRLAIGGGSSNTGSATGTAGESGNAATIEAGRYVTRRVYIGAKQSTAGSTQAQVQIDLTKSLKLQTTLGTGGGTVQGATPQNDPGSSVGLSYQFEY